MLLAQMSDHQEIRPRLYVLLRDNFQPKNWAALQGWLKLFWPEIATEEPSSRLQLLQQGLTIAPHASLQNQALPGLQPLAESLFTEKDGKYAKAAHESWQEVCLTDHATLLAYLQYCAKEPEAAIYTEPVLDRLLAQHQLSTLIELTDVPGTPRWRQACFMAQCIDEFRRRVRFKAGIRLESNDFNELERIFDARNDPEQADMLAVTYAQLRSGLSRSYLTPVTRQIEAMCLGGRFGLAREFAARYPSADLRVGRWRAPAEEYIREMETKVHARSASPNSDYRQIARQLLSEGAGVPNN